MQHGEKGHEREIRFRLSVSLSPLREKGPGKEGARPGRCTAACAAGGVPGYGEGVAVAAGCGTGAVIATWTVDWPVLPRLSVAISVAL